MLEVAGQPFGIEAHPACRRAVTWRYVLKLLAAEGRLAGPFGFGRPRDFAGYRSGPFRRRRLDACTRTLGARRQSPLWVISGH